MHVIGARFVDLGAAVAALDAIRTRVAVPPGDAAVRPLGSTRYEQPARDFVLAGRFELDDVPLVTAILERHGGHVLRAGVEPPGAEWLDVPRRPWLRSSRSIRRAQYVTASKVSYR